jgi:hypothetical protein
VCYSFPQEVVNQTRTGGRTLTVEVPDSCDGEVEIDEEEGIFLVQPFTQENGQFLERLMFVVQVTKTRAVFTDRAEKASPIVLERVRSFPIKAGRSCMQWEVVFPETQQPPELPKRIREPQLAPN